MSRSSFFSRRSSHDNDPLLPQYKDSTSSRPISLRDLSPRSENSKSPFREVSPSPPPSFYRDNNFTSNNQSQHTSLSPSPSRTKPRRIQYEILLYTPYLSTLNLPYVISECLSFSGTFKIVFNSARIGSLTLQFPGSLPLLHP
jgi:hypothetical protein